MHTNAPPSKNFSTHFNYSIKDTEIITSKLHYRNKKIYLQLANIEGTVIDFFASFVMLVEKYPFYHGILVPLFDIWRQIVIGKN